MSLQTVTHSTNAQTLVYKTEFMWSKMSQVQVQYEIKEWLNQYASGTRETYFWHMCALEDLGLIEVYKTLDSFAMINHNEVVDKIKLSQSIGGTKESTLQGRAAAYISFTVFLSRKYEGMIKRANANTTKSNKTFFATRTKCSTQVLNRSQWESWLYELSQINQRDHLIALIILGGAKRVSEVLSLSTENIDYATNTITFRQLKTERTENYTYISYPKRVMDLLKSYINQRTGIVFLTSGGKVVPKQQLHITFGKASYKAGLPFKVHPHVLRASIITYLKEQGYAGDDIMKISGHTDIKSVLYYDKTELRDNLSKRTSWV